MKKTFFLSLLICLAAALCFSLPYDELIPSYAPRLREGIISETQLKKPQPLLMPNHEGLAAFVNAAFNELGPTLAVEVLHLYKKPVSSGSWNETQKTALFNKTTALSSLAGIEYFSASRNAMRVFYETSAIIDSPESKRNLPDPFFSYMPESYSVYARQKDLTFGDNIYRYDFRSTNDAFYFMQENMTALSYGIIPAAGKNKLRSVVAIIDCDEYLLIYGISFAKAVSLPGMSDRIGRSFTNRANAIIKWFTANADLVFM